MDDRTNLPPGLRTIWWVVNSVALLQGLGFLSRLLDPAINRVLGVAIATLAVPATHALVRLIRSGSERRLWIGPIVFDAFVLCMLWVDYLWPVEFRSPRRPGILIPYLVLFFGSILAMGAPMLRYDRRRWALTAFSAVFLTVAMVIAQISGVG